MRTLSYVFNDQLLLNFDASSIGKKMRLERIALQSQKKLYFMFYGTLKVFIVDCTNITTPSDPCFGIQNGQTQTAFGLSHNALYQTIHVIFPSFFKSFSIVLKRGRATIFDCSLYLPNYNKLMLINLSLIVSFIHFRFFSHQLVKIR